MDVSFDAGIVADIGRVIHVDVEGYGIGTGEAMEIITDGHGDRGQWSHN